MKASVLTTENKWKELNITDGGMQFVLSEDISTFMAVDAGLYINLRDDAGEPDYSSVKQPVLVNSVSIPLTEISGNNICRFNGWDGFLQRPVWEVSGKADETCELFFNTAGKKIITIPDVPGFISARVLSMIVNEAWYALEAGVSTKEEIDIAMKLGTNYPMGPFEWSEKIGLKNIDDLLKKLAITENKYTPCILLSSSAKNN